MVGSSSMSIVASVVGGSFLFRSDCGLVGRERSVGLDPWFGRKIEYMLRWGVALVFFLLDGGEAGDELARTGVLGSVSNVVPSFRLPCCIFSNMSNLFIISS